MLHNYFVYITTNENKTTLYTGVTNNIQQRLSQHYIDSQNFKKSFAGKYNCYYLLYYEGFEDINLAINREKEIKKWRREKKDKLISDFNPDWNFLNDQVI
jgi:putative endonuclease